MTYVHALGNSLGTIYVTNYRLIFDPDTKVSDAISVSSMSCSCLFSVSLLLSFSPLSPY